MAEKFSPEALEQLKRELLKCGELEARTAIDTIFNLIEIIVKDTENKFDDVILLATPRIKECVLQLIDKISEDV